MDNPSFVPSLSPAEAEAFWATGSDARASATEQPDLAPGTQEQICCAGADVPGVGTVHSPGCLHQGSPKRSGRALETGDASEAIPGTGAGQSGQLPDTLRAFLDRDEQDALLIKLMFAARRMAERSVSAGFQEWHYCLECGRLHGDGRHGVHCCVGEVLGVLAELEQLQARTEQERQLAGFENWQRRAIGASVPDASLPDATGDSVAQQGGRK